MEMISYADDPQVDGLENSCKGVKAVRQIHVPVNANIASPLHTRLFTTSRTNDQTSCEGWREMVKDI